VMPAAPNLNLNLNLGLGPRAPAPSSEPAQGNKVGGLPYLWATLSPSLTTDMALSSGDHSPQRNVVLPMT
jgi:hypothetical protein